LIWFLFSKNKYIKVKDINVNRVVMRERIGGWFHHSPHNNGQSLINKGNSYYILFKARLIRVVKKLPLKNKYKPSLIGTDSPFKH
jgi:hypothetical protein